MNDKYLNTYLQKLRFAPNGKRANALLADHLAIVKAGDQPLWTFTVHGNAKGFPEPFRDACDRAANYVDLVSQ
jgi:hypothetical protein